MDKNKAVLEANQSDLIIYKNLHNIFNTVECLNAVRIV